MAEGWPQGCVPRVGPVGVSSDTSAAQTRPHTIDGVLRLEYTYTCGAPAEGEGWREIDRAVLAHLRRNPSDAVSVLSYANQSGLIDSLSYEFPAAESGLGFRCEAALIDHQDPGPHR